MTRNTLRLVIVLGALITLLGGTGIFAVLTDRATAGGNSVGTGAQPKAADIQIATTFTIGGSSFTCDTFQDNISTAQFTVSNIQPGFTNRNDVCVKNVGAAAISVTMGTLDLTDLDTDCTGDEAVAGDTTCGLDATMTPQAGELSPLLDVTLTSMDCSTDAPIADDGSAKLDTLVNGNFVASTSLAPGEVLCLAIDLGYSPSTVDAQLAQSDTATWRFKFDAYAN